MDTANQPTREPQANPPMLWGYAQSFLIAGELLILGFALEVIFRGNGIHSPHMPYNLVILLVFVTLLLGMHKYFRKNMVVRWLSSVPCSVSAISVYALLVLLLGFIPQDKPAGKLIDMLGFTHMKNSWPFLLIQVYLLLSLGLVVLKRAIPFSTKNLGFLLNHLGLWMVLVAGGLGSGDMQRLSLELIVNGNYKNLAYQGEHHIMVLPFSLQLLDFKLTQYNPKIAIADSRSGDVISKSGDVLPPIEKGMVLHLHHWTILVKEVLPYALHSDSLGYFPSNDPGNAAAAYVEGRNNLNSDSIKGWLCSGSIRLNPQYIQLPDSQLLFITNPDPKKFESKVVVMMKNGHTDTTILEVNKPHKVREWTLYQLSYDAQMGPASQTSVIEAVYDPWLPVVYVGIFLMLGGGIYLFWLGRGAQKEQNEA